MERGFNCCIVCPLKTNPTPPHNSKKKGKKKKKKKKYRYWFCRVAIFELGPLQWICREQIRKLGSDEATARSEGRKTYRIGQPKGPREKGPFARGLESPSPLASLEPLPFSWASFLFPSPLLWVISVIIYPSLPFILFLHLSVIHTHTRVCVPSATFLALCELLWPPSHYPRVTSTSMGSGC